MRGFAWRNEWLRVVSVVLVSIYVLTACGDSDDETDPAETLPPPSATPMLSATLDSDGDGFLNLTELEQAVFLVFDDYRWPEAYTPTARGIVDYFSGGQPMTGHRFQPGLEHTLIGSWHSCAWYMAWLDARQSGNGDLEADAIEVMTHVLPVAPHHTDSAQAHLEGIAEKASLGDPAMVKQYVKVNCDGLEWNEDS